VYQMIAMTPSTSAPYVDTFSGSQLSQFTLRPFGRPALGEPADAVTRPIRRQDPTRDQSGSCVIVVMPTT
jgi:hypothetical protein